MASLPRHGPAATGKNVERGPTVPAEETSRFVGLFGGMGLNAGQVAFLTAGSWRAGVRPFPFPNFLSSRPPTFADSLSTF